MDIDVQYALDETTVDSHPTPKAAEFRAWVNAALSSETLLSETVTSQDDTQLTIRIVDEKESAQLNEHYRQKKGPTNVLSFPAELAADIPVTLLGDIVICAPLVINEAKAQNKDVQSHWAHLTIHGSLHLLGFDHINEQDAQKMESCEIEILRQIGFTNPYI